MKSGVADTAAAEGVGALRSETKSAMVMSVSCPMELIMGVVQLYISLARSSSLNAQRSSNEPPPLARIITSQFWDWSAALRALMIFRWAFSPWTMVS